MIDYKELLTKYIEEVGTQEGTDFIPKNINILRNGKSITIAPFDHEELEALWNCTGWNELEGKYD